MTKKPRTQGDGPAGSLSPLTDQLRAAITSSGLSLYQLAQDAGVDAAVLSRFVRGERDITLGTADRLAVALRLKLVRGGKGR